MASILSISNTRSTPVTIPASASPTTLVTFNVGENNYQAVEVDSTVTITTAAGSTSQAIIFEMRVNGTVIPATTGQAGIIKNIVAAGAVGTLDTVTPIRIIAKVNNRASVTLTVRANGGTADTNTTVTVQTAYALAHF